MNGNRDYFTKPIQGGGRDASDYGRTVLKIEREPMDWRGIIGWSMVLTPIVFAVFLSVWVVLP